MRCTILTQLPVAFCAGSTENSAPDAGLIEATRACHFLPGNVSTSIVAAWPTATCVRSVSLKFASTQSVVATSGIAAWPIARKSPGCSVVLPITPSIGARTVACSRSSFACASCASASL